jgi:hypothetical protein
MVLMKKYSQQKINKKDATAIISEGRKHVEDWRAYYADNIERHRNSVKFININDEMWSREERRAFDAAHRIRLSVNKVRPRIKQLLGEDRQYEVDIKLREVSEDKEKMAAPMTTPQGMMGNPQASSQAIPSQIAQSSMGNQSQTPNFSEILTGLVRNIAYHSRSLSIYNSGYENAVEGGYGGWRIIVCEKGGKNELRIARINNILNAYFDPIAKNLVKTDGEYAGVSAYMSKSEYNRKYGDRFPYPTSFEFPRETTFDWGNDERITICEEYRRETYKIKLFKLEDDSEIDADELKASPQLKDVIVSSRIEERNRIVHYKFTFNYLLEHTETPFENLPIFFVPGSLKYIDGKEYTFSFVEDAKDAQRQLNFIASDIYEWLKITKKTKYMASTDMIKGHEQSWNDPSAAESILPFNPGGAGEVQAPIPVTPPRMPQDLVDQYMRLQQDIEFALGRYAANVGAPSNETSGIAVFNRALQGNSSLEIQRNNRNYAIAETGKEILRAIPKVYDTPRSIVITNAAGKDINISINQMRFDGKTAQYVQEKTFEQNAATIEVSVGASFPMQRANTAKLMLDMIKLDPSGRTYPLVARYIPKLLQVDQADKYSKVLETLVPPDILAEERGESVPPNQMQQMEMMEKQLEIMKQKQDLTNTHMETMQKHIEGMVDIYNAQTERMKVTADTSVQSQKAQAEIRKSDSELQKVELEMQRDVLKDIMGGHVGR